MCNNPKYFKNIYAYGTKKLYPVPCHGCEGCRIDRRTLWERRITSEYVKYRCAFVTLTYNDYYLPFNPGALLPSARINDVRRFLDRLRHEVRSLPDKGFPDFCTKDFKVVFVSEYGSDKMRPHYHGLILGLDWLYFKKMIEKQWYLGLTDVGPIRSGGIRYILKYMDSLPNGEYALNQFYDVGLEVPQFIFSRGIGKDFFISQVDNINKYGVAKVGNRFIPIPSYWKNKLFNYCDKNIYSMREHQNDYVRQMNEQVYALGYDSYDSFLRQARKALEISYEKRLLKKHEPTAFLSRFINNKVLPAGSELVLDYV